MASKTAVFTGNITIETDNGCITGTGTVFMDTEKANSGSGEASAVIESSAALTTEITEGQAIEIAGAGRVKIK